MITIEYGDYGSRKTRDINKLLIHIEKCAFYDEYWEWCNSNNIGVISSKVLTALMEKYIEGDNQIFHKRLGLEQSQLFTLVSIFHQFFTKFKLQNEYLKWLNNQ